MARIGNGTTTQLYSPAITIPGSAGGGYAISMWYRNGTAPNSASIAQPFYWGTDADDGIQFAWHHSTEGARQSWNYWDGTQWVHLKYSTSLQADTWYHLYLDSDGAGHGVYLNGEFEVSTSSLYPTTASGENINVFAAIESGSPVNFDDGEIAELAIWSGDYPNDKQIRAMGNGTPAWKIYPSQLAYYWPFKSGRRPYDWVGGVTLTETGTQAFGADPAALRYARSQSIYLAGVGSPIINQEAAVSNFSIGASLT